MTGVILLWCLLWSHVFLSGQTCNTPVINWTDIIAVSKTITTLQVVGNPLLNPNTSPVADKIFNLLSQVNTNMIRCDGSMDLPSLPKFTTSSN